MGSEAAGIVFAYHVMGSRFLPDSTRPLGVPVDDSSGRTYAVRWADRSLDMNGWTGAPATDLGRQDRGGRHRLRGCGGGQDRSVTESSKPGSWTSTRSGRGAPAQTAATWRKVSPLGVDGLDHVAVGEDLGVGDHLVDAVDRSDAGVRRAELGHPLVASAGGEGGGEVGRDLVLDGIVALVRGPLLAAEEAAQVGVELRLDGPYETHFPSAQR